MPQSFPSKRAPAFREVPDEKWNDWRWQLSNRLNSAADFEKVLHLTDSERKALDTHGLFRVDITPYFASLIDPSDANDPVRRQVVPRVFSSVFQPSTFDHACSRAESMPDFL